MFSETKSPAVLRFRDEGSISNTINFQTVYQPIDLIFQFVVHYIFSASVRLCDHALKSDAVRLILTCENDRNRCSNIHRLKI